MHHALKIREGEVAKLYTILISVLGGGEWSTSHSGHLILG